MFVALGITLFYIIFVWLIFFKLELLKFNIAWGIVSFWVGAHLLLIFLVALRFFQRPSRSTAMWCVRPYRSSQS